MSWSHIIPSIIPLIIPIFHGESYVYHLTPFSSPWISKKSPPRIIMNHHSIVTSHGYHRYFPNSRTRLIGMPWIKPCARTSRSPSQSGRGLAHRKDGRMKHEIVGDDSWDSTGLYWYCGWTTAISPPAINGGFHKYLRKTPLGRSDPVGAVVGAVGGPWCWKHQDVRDWYGWLHQQPLVA